MDLSKLTALEGPNGEDNTPGLQGYVLFAPESYFATIATAPKYSAAQASAGISAVIAETHTFKDGLGFLKVYMTLDSNELKAETTGERDGRGLKVMVEGFHPGNRAEVTEMLNLIKNTGGILLVPDADGKYIQVGAQGLPAEVSFSYGSGKLSGGRRGYTIKAEAYANAIRLYEGDVTYKPVL